MFLLLQNVLIILCVYNNVLEIIKIVTQSLFYVLVLIFTVLLS